MPEGIRHGEPQPIAESEKHEPYLIVEIGVRDTGMLRFATHMRNKLERNPDAQYIAVDLDDDEKGIRTDRKQTHRHMPAEKDRIHHVIADGRELPLGASKVDEIIMKDVLGAPYVNGTDGFKLIEESIRALKPGGQLKIFECATPKLAMRYLQFIEEDFGDILKLVEHREYDDKAHWQRVRDHDFETESDAALFDRISSGQDDFMMIFEKLAEQT